MPSLCVACLGVVVLLVFARGYFGTELRINRGLRKVPRTPIGQIGEGGLAKVVGKVTYVHQPLVAPLSGRACAYYEVIVEQCNPRGTWQRIIKEVQGQDFLVLDDTGKIQCPRPARPDVDGAVRGEQEDPLLGGRARGERDDRRRWAGSL